MTFTEKGENMKTEKALSEIPVKIAELIESYKEDLDKAWLKHEEDEPLSISFGAKVFVKDGKNQCEVSISFIKERIKDKITFPWDDRQLTFEGIDKSKTTSV